MPRSSRPPSHDVDADLADALVGIFQDQRMLARQERRSIARIGEHQGDALVVVPELEADVHDLRGLKTVGELMFGKRES